MLLLEEQFLGQNIRRPTKDQTGSDITVTHVVHVCTFTNQPLVLHFPQPCLDQFPIQSSNYRIFSNIQSISFNSIRVVTGSLLETNQAVVKIILESHRDIWNNPDLFSLVEKYFENSKQTLDFCSALENCLKRARNNQLIIQLAVNYFDEEVELGVGPEGKKFVKTLEELRKFKAAEEPFPKEFFLLLDSVRSQQQSMLGKLLARKRKLDKKWKSLKTWRVSNVLFVATFVSVLIFSVVAAAIAAPPVVTALAGALSVPIGSIGRWCNSLWKRYEKEVREQMELTATLDFFTRLKIYDIDDIRVLVSRLEIKIESLLQTADFVLGQEDALKLAMGEIKRKLGEFMEIIEELGQQADKCSHDIRMARAVILQRMMRGPSTTSTGDSPWELEQ